MFQEQQKARRQGLELPEILLPKNPYHEEYKPTVNKPRETWTRPNLPISPTFFTKMKEV
ncbi:31015_t:CDS:2, partial [Racocetra persica]